LWCSERSVVRGPVARVACVGVRAFPDFHQRPRRISRRAPAPGKRPGAPGTAPGGPGHDPGGKCRDNLGFSRQNPGSGPRLLVVLIARWRFRAFNCFICHTCLFYDNDIGVGNFIDELPRRIAGICRKSSTETGNFRFPRMEKLGACGGPFFKKIILLIYYIIRRAASIEFGNSKSWRNFRAPDFLLNFFQNFVKKLGLIICYMNTE
jgi:hypothetical protein